MVIRIPSGLRSIRIPYFAIWYSSAFVVIFFITFVLTIISPADLVYQAISNRAVPSAISIGVVYVLTILICSFIWASRIYTNRVALRDIPKFYIPVDNGEVPRKVRRLIVKHWERSAIVAWDGRPRDVRGEVKKLENDHERAEPKEACQNSSEISNAKKKQHHHDKDRTIISPEAAKRTWGRISHSGWSSPAADETPNLHYSTVIVELANLIEAKAVSLAPPDPMYLDQTGNAIPDERIVTLLRRPPSLGLRDYLLQLAEFKLLPSPKLVNSFLQKYESARFSGKPLNETEFSDIMAVFASILAGMTSLDVAAIEQALDAFDSDDISFDSREDVAPSRSSSIHTDDSSVIHRSIYTTKTHQPATGSDAAEFSSSLRSSSSLSSRALRSPNQTRRYASAATNLRPPSHHRLSSSGTVLTAPSRMSHANTLNTLFHSASPSSSRSGSLAASERDVAGQPNVDEAFYEEAHEADVVDAERSSLESPKDSHSSVHENSRPASTRSGTGSIIVSRPGPSEYG